MEPNDGKKYRKVEKVAGNKCLGTLGAVNISIVFVERCGEVYRCSGKTTGDCKPDTYNREPELMNLCWVMVVGVMPGSLRARFDHGCDLIFLTGRVNKGVMLLPDSELRY